MEALKITHKTTTRFSETYPESTIEDILKKILLSTNLPGERGVTSGIVQDDALQVKHRQPQCSSQTSSQWLIVREGGEPLPGYEQVHREIFHKQYQDR
jgi:hypothetical protein